jgi:hypothetical protein
MPESLPPGGYSPHCLRRGKVINLLDDVGCGDAEHSSAAVGPAGITGTVESAVAGLDQRTQRLGTVGVIGCEGVEDGNRARRSHLEHSSVARGSAELGGPIEVSISSQAQPGRGLCAVSGPGEPVESVHDRIRAGSGDAELGA